MYGGVRIVRAWCAACARFALVVKGELQCCDAKFVRENPNKQKRMIESELVRRGPSAACRRRVLAGQDNRCLYCMKAFGFLVNYHGKQRRLRITWDHASPLAYSQNNLDSNFVAACQFCNGWKSDKIFQTIEEVRLYVAIKWEDEEKRVPQGQMRLVRAGIRA